MTGQQMINLCTNIIKRQDINTDLLLSFINQQRRIVLRQNYLYKIQKWVTGLDPVNGFVELDTLKQARYVEWNPDEDDNTPTNPTTNPTAQNGITSNRRKKLFPLSNMQEAFEFIDNVDAEGEPQYYVVLQGGLKIIPAPTKGVINVFGEWYPEDFENTPTSLAKKDAIAKELSDIISYYACGEYFDFLNEPEKAELWRQKGNAQLLVYKAEIKRQITDDREMFARDPFGNLGINHGWRYNQQYIYPSGGGSGGNYSTMSQQEVEDTFDDIVNGGNNP